MRHLTQSKRKEFYAHLMLRKIFFLLSIIKTIFTLGHRQLTSVCQCHESEVYIFLRLFDKASL